MGTRISALKLYVFIISLALASHLFKVAQSSKVWDEVPFPEDLEEEDDKLPGGYVDDEEYDGSGESNSGDGDGSTPEPNQVYPGATIYYRALVNFTNSFQYGPELDDIYSPAFQEISSAVVDTLESDYNTIPGVQTVNVVLIKQIGRDVFVELDVGSENNSNEPQIRGVLYSVVKEGTIASYDISVVGFDFRRLGEVKPFPRECLPDEFTCKDGSCINRDYVCDHRPDCIDLSDEMNCVAPVPRPATTLPPPRTRPPPGPGPCRVDQATCQNGQCIARDYLCDGEQDCADGSDEFSCGTPSPCEPNEFKCQNGRCALKLWRCDGDNDCQDNSDEIDCPTKGPRDTCAPEQFVCLSDRNCIPASYQCDEEPDCADRSDEYGCAPPTVIAPPQESISAARGDTVTFTCVATGVPTPIITWRLNWGHLPANNRITMTNEKGQGTLTIRDVKEGDQGAYTCEAINAKGLVFAIPDGVLSLSQRPNPGNCPDGHFSVGDQHHCMPCFCFGITKNCQSTGHYRSQITLRFTEEDDFKGVNVSFPSRPGTTPPLSSTQMMINLDTEEFQLVDLSRRFLDQDSYWSLPRQFLGNKVDSYGGYLKYKVNYFLQRGGSEPKEKPDVVLTGNGQRFIYRRGEPTYPDTLNQREIKFTEENWQHSSGRAVTRDDLMMALANLETIQIRTIYDNRMASVGLSDISMDITTKEFTAQGNPRDVEECRCPPGYSGLSCETCSPGFERVPGLFLGSCAGCSCNGHASACDPISGHCLSCQHNTEGPQCNKCKSGYFGDPSQGRYDDCKPCPCPYTETSRRFSDSCFLDHDNRATCDACRTGYTGRRCEKCAPGYQGNPLEPNGKCVPVSTIITKCDNRGTINPISRPCYCKGNVVGGLCDECKIGAFHLSADNPEGCLPCFCMGVTKQCASSTWSRDQVRGGVNGQLFTLSNAANTRTISEGIVQRASTEVVYRSFSRIPNDIYYWVLPENFRGDKVTAYGGELQYRLRYELQPRSLVIDGQPDVVLQGNGIFLEHYSQTKPLPRVSTPITVSFRESAWRRSDGQPCTREHLLMALADITAFMIRATYADNMAESSISDIQMDVAVPHSTGSERALEVEECACPQGYRGPSCQDCDVGYTRTPGLYLGTCEKCECYGHASGCDSETGDCLGCQHNTAGRNCENCLAGFYGNPKSGDPQACSPCLCLGPTNTQRSCFLDSDGQPTCECPAGYTGRRCERCASGYIGNPQLGQRCILNNNNGDCYRCDQSGSEGCSSNGVCRCKMNVEGSTCSTCKQGTFYLSPSNKDGCLSCFCMGVTQQCSSSNHYRDVISTTFAPGNYQGFALVNRQRTNRIDTGFSVELSTEGTQLSYTNFNYLGHEPHYWQLPNIFQGDKVGTYGGKLKYTISYVPGVRGSHVDDVDVQITGNDITLVARIPWARRTGSRVSYNFEIVFREEYWQRPDGMPATREHLMMLLADLDDILIRASYDTEMRSSSISGVRMEIAVPQYTGLARAFEVEQCQCPPGYHGLSCQDCAPGYTRTGGGLYLGHCEPCECNSHSDSCHPETGICTSCQHNTRGELCEQCADGFFGDATAGTPEDCQPCACPGTDPDNQFSRTCESLGNGGYQCTACQHGYTGQYCERCAPGYEGNPLERRPCRIAAEFLVVRILPERVEVAQGNQVTLRCQVSGNPPHYFYWSREDGRLISNTAERHNQGQELHFPSVRPSDSGVYICTCRDQRSTNRSKAEIVVRTLPSKPIEVFIEEPKIQPVKVGTTVSFICTARSKLPAYTLVWTRRGKGKLPNRAMDFNGILTIQNVQPGDADTYVCTGSNMLGMDEGTAHLYVPEASQSQMLYTAYEMFEGHRKPAEGSQPVATVNPRVLTVNQGDRAEFRCTVSGNPTPAVEWIGAPGNRISSKAIIRNGVLTISSVDRSDEGEYICKALNTHGEHTARGVLHVQSTSSHHSLPLVQVSTKSIEAHEGDTLRLYCRAIGNPTPILTWKKRGGPLPPQTRGERTDIGTLLVPNIRSSDAGTYICVGTNSAGSSEAYIEVSVKKGEIFPSGVTIQPSTPTVMEGEALDLDCSVPGTSSTSVKWSRAGRLLSSNHQVLGTRLRILQASSDDVGEYICHVESGPSSLQASVFVSVTSSASRFQTPIISIEPHSAVVKQGESASFKCRVHSGAPPVGLEWKPTTNQSFPDNVVIGPENSVITIINAQAKNHGTYKCVARNLYGSTQSMVTLIVKESPKTIVTPTGPVRVRVGDPINLMCQAAGEPRPSVRWHRLDNNRRTILTSLASADSIASVQILAARPEDSGTYMCIAQNNQGTTETRVDVIVEGEHEIPTVPRVSVREPVIVVAEGSTATLHCEVHGFPKPTITWSKDRSSLPWRHKAVDNSLVITNVRRQDSGHYICNATNHMGTSEVTIMLEVGESPKAVVTPTGPVRVRVGDPINLMCQAAGEPRPSVRWHRLDNNRRTMLTSPASADSSASVQILVARPEDSGTYVCTAQSNHGTTETRVDVIVEGEHQIPTVPQASVRKPLIVVAEGSTATLHCEAHGFPKPTITWSKKHSSLPWGHKIVSNILVLHNVGRQDSGQYVCNATNHMGTSEATIMLEVGESPKAVVTPTGPVRVRVGDPINLECQAAGEPRPSVRWHRLDNNRRTMLTSPVPADSSAIMQILVARPEDSGTYVCTAQSNQGTTETRVDVIVEGGPQIPTIPRVIVREPMIVVVEGSTATLHCEAHGFPKPTITWSKERSSLPWRHKIVNNSLVLSNVGRQDSGQYVCNATNHMGVSEATIMLEVDTPPYATSLPDDLSVRVGEVIRLQCLAHGTPPLRYEWSKVNGTLPRTAQVQGGDLQINLATDSDAGTYKCISSNKVGTSEALARVSVRSPLSIKVSPQVEVKALGSAVEFTCSAKGGSQIQIEWLKEGGVLPPNHHIYNGVLRIENLEQSNEGIYTCRARSLYGQAQDSAKLTIQALPKVMINVRTSVQTVMVGNSVEFECHAEGDPQPSVRWSKVGGTLPNHVVVKGNVLRIEQVTEADRGKYRCTASNNVGSVQSDVDLKIQALPEIAAQPETKEVTVGSDAIFPCIASGYPVPTITWSKVDNELPSKCRQDGHVLTVPAVTHTDAGLYVCTAANKHGKVEAFTKLLVHERVMPQFTQEPLSYLTLPTIKNSYKAFSIKITFRPDNVDGMILYNGQKRTTGADFISFGLVGGRPEFRFDVGSGMANIRYPTSIKLGEFHTVELHRNLTHGSLVVDGDHPVNGSSQGKFKGLDLNEELFVGGYPNYSVIAKTAGIKTGFVGCIKQLVIQGDEVIFKDLEKSSVGVSNCPTCKDQPCQNGGKCEDSVASLYKCNCQRGYTGSNCQHHSSLRCHSEACGPDATCINNPNGLGYKCRCHLGKSGDKCMDGALVTTPLFDGEDSYIAYPPLTNVHNDLRIEMEFKPMDPDGLMFFCGGQKVKVEDFVTLSMVNGHVEFRYELGTGQAVLRSQDPVSLNKWHRVVAERLDKDGSLKVDHAREISRSSPGKAQGLNIFTAMYLGGVPSMDILPKPANVSMLFEGCIGEVFINGKKVDISYSFTENRSIRQCSQVDRPCDRRPCLHGGTCMSTAEYEYQCLCSEGYEGDRCEVVKEACRVSSQCQNGGTCVNKFCVCPAGYTGRHCEKDSPLQHSAYFHDNGYLALPKPMFPRSSPDSPETIELEINTVSSDGLVFWQGVEQGYQGKGKDFVSLGLKNGRVVFSYQLGSGEANIESRETVNDGQWHKVTAVRTGRHGYLQINGGSVHQGQSKGKSVMVDTKGNIYLGGAPDMKSLTDGKFSASITGCVRNVSLLNARPGEQPAQPIDLQVHAEEGINVERCST